MNDLKKIRHPEKINKPDNISPKKPFWLKVKAPQGKIFEQTKDLLDDLNITTVCEEASCPNIGNCWSKKHATMMIMGDICTRRCPFCDVAHGRPLPLDKNEPKNLAESIYKLNLNYVVVTSVDRDDLKDGGAAHFVECINSIKNKIPNIKIEILIPDFRGRENLAIKSFDLVIALTGGGPGYATDLPATYMYTMAFSRGDIGQAASSAIIMMLVVFAVVVPYLYSELRNKND